MARLSILTGLTLVALTHVTMAITVQEFFPEIKNNLTKIKWYHAANSEYKMFQALNSTEVMMIEADVVFGYQKFKNGSVATMKSVILAHPPESISDLSLSGFLMEVKKHNKKNNITKKGIKLDFKTIEAFQESTQIIQNTLQFEAPIWLNADILKGPGNVTSNMNETMPVDPQKFIEVVRNLKTPNLLLSVGWTTSYVAPVGNATISGNYTSMQIKEMLNLVNSSAVNQPITYPVRACYAANDITALKTLLESTPAKHNATLTIWSAEGDKVDTNKLSQLVRTIGVTKVFVDVPQSLLDKLEFNSAFTAKSSVFVVFASMIIALFTAKLL